MRKSKKRVWLSRYGGKESIEIFGSNECVKMTLELSDSRKVAYLTPREARILAKRLFELADDIDCISWED